ncbi:MAG: hypothetical protein ACJ8J7_13845 [Sulfurifustaceae bacterium]
MANNNYVVALLVLLCIPAHAADLVVEAGKSEFSYCGAGAGCWRNPPLPYHESRDVSSGAIGVRLNILPSLDAEIIYRTFGTARVGGDYVSDADYAAKRFYTDSAYHCEMWVWTYGLSADLKPTYKFGRWEAHAKFGVFYYRQEIFFDRKSAFGASTLREAGYDFTREHGVGIGYRIGKRSSIGIDYTAMRHVRVQESPVGDGEAPGLKTIGLTLRYSVL